MLLKPFPKVAAIMGSNFCNTQKSKTLKSQYSSHDLYYKKMYKQWKKQYWNFSSEGDGPLLKNVFYRKNEIPFS
jgi:hypothetical protein